ASARENLVGVRPQYSREPLAIRGDTRVGVVIAGYGEADVGSLGPYGDAGHEELAAFFQDCAGAVLRAGERALKVGCVVRRLHTELEGASGDAVDGVDRRARFSVSGCGPVADLAARPVSHEHDRLSRFVALAIRPDWIHASHGAAQPDERELAIAHQRF